MYIYILIIIIIIYNDNKNNNAEKTCGLSFSINKEIMKIEI